MVALLPLAPEIVLGLGACLAALLYVILLNNRANIERLVNSILGSIPVFGSTLSRYVSAGIAAAWLQLNTWADGVVRPFASLVIAPVQWATAGASIIVGSVEYGYARTRSLASATVAAVGRLGRDISANTANVGRLLSTVFSATLGLAAAWATLRIIRSTDIPRAQAAAESHSAAYSRSQAAAALASARAELATAKAALAASLATETAARKAGDLDLARKAAAAAAAAAASVAALSTRVAELERVRIPALEHELEQVRTQDIPAERARATAAEAAIVAELSLAQEALRCLDPLCRSGFSNLVGDLFAGAELLALLELVGAAIHDPEDQAHDTAGAVGTPLGAVSGLLSGVLGVEL